VRGSASRPPGPRGLPLAGSLFRYLGGQLAFIESAARRHGDVVRFRLGPSDVFLLSHPDDIERVLLRDPDVFVKSRGLERMKILLGQGLLTSEGAAHLRRRRQVQPAFHRPVLERYGRIMLRRTRALEATWTPGATVDVAAEMRTLALGIAGECFFGAELDAEVEEVRVALDRLIAMFPRLVLPFAEYLEKLPLPSTLRFRREKERLDAIVYRIVDDALANGRTAVSDRGSAGRPSDGDVARGGAEGKAEVDPTAGDALALLVAGEGGEGLDREEIRDEVLTLLLAGHETTANALAWTFWLLARNPEAEAELHRELDRVLGGRAPTVEDLPRLDAARRVVAEAMRLYPPAWLIGRRATEDWDVRGYPVPAGSMVFMSQWVVHRDPRWWPEPERFDPGRWKEGEARGRRPRFAYFPFGGGPRVCIGNYFAKMEAALIIATIAQQFELQNASDRPLETYTSITQRPAHPIYMRVSRRE